MASPCARISPAFAARRACSPCRQTAPCCSIRRTHGPPSFPSPSARPRPPLRRRRPWRRTAGSCRRRPLRPVCTARCPPPRAAASAFRNRRRTAAARLRRGRAAYVCLGRGQGESPGPAASLTPAAGGRGPVPPPQPRRAPSPPHGAAQAAEGPSPASLPRSGAAAGGAPADAVRPHAPRAGARGDRPRRALGMIQTSIDQMNSARGHGGAEQSRPPPQGACGKGTRAPGREGGTEGAKRQILGKVAAATSELAVLGITCRTMGAAPAEATGKGTNGTFRAAGWVSGCVPFPAR